MRRRSSLTCAYFTAAQRCRSQSGKRRPREPPRNPSCRSNLGAQGKDTVFGAAMPQASYGDVELAVAAHDFIATVTVTGSRTQSEARATKLGAFTVFDLTRQRLGRSTVLHLPRSDFRYLHFRITGPLAPASITGLSLLRLPQEEPTYATVAQAARIKEENRRTVIEFAVPAHVPVDRALFTPGPEPRSFSRDVTVSAMPASPPSETADAEPPQPRTFSGTLLRLHTVEDGQKIDEERLALDTPYGEQERPSRWTVSVENGDDAPLPLASVRLEMLERKVCFEPGSRNGYALFYGDPMLPAPQYDYAALHASTTPTPMAVAGAEQLNGEYRPRPDARPFTERHPALLWTALAGVILLLGCIALRSSRKTSSPPS